ncbi:hypothetical protein LSH36_488g05039 [Paralvinella palmiformis]|uniref:EF-hand domain-containing protein n=1 Tax=Paralvinella palmiformis TaxID=53620 RepID=A0AAD9MZE8_9ANNE|nr:hypothetical protein LSH36_488g05039 [Paralvinella palmiformis]
MYIRVAATSKTVEMRSRFGESFLELDRIDRFGCCSRTLFRTRPSIPPERDVIIQEKPETSPETAIEKEEPREQEDLVSDITSRTEDVSIFPKLRASPYNQQPMAYSRSFNRVVISADESPLAIGSQRLITDESYSGFGALDMKKIVLRPKIKVKSSYYNNSARLYKDSTLLKTAGKKANKVRTRRRKGRGGTRKSDLPSTLSVPNPDTNKPEKVSRIPPDPLEKRVRWRAQPQKRERFSGDTEKKSASDSSWKGRQGSWLFGDDDYSTTITKDTPEQTEQGSGSGSISVGPPPLPEIQSPPLTGGTDSTPRKSPDKQKIIPDWVKKKYGRKKRDPNWEEEQRRKRLADERREKALGMYEKLRRKRYTDEEEEEIDLSGGPRFEDYGWLAQYCIFQRNNLELFKRTFEAVDDQNKGYLGPVDTILALRAINNKLSLAEEEYLYRIMELAGYSISAGTDFKLYAIMAALSQRISSLDDWMKHLIGEMDFSTLERKLFMCKTLWECNVDPDTNTISIDQLCVELRAGGVSPEHEREVREKLGHLGSLDLLDFMSYVPLFIMIHKSVVRNPLDDSRLK